MVPFSRSTLKRLVVPALSLAALLAGLGWGGTAWLQRQAGRDAVAGFASARLGRPVRIGGTLHASLLPGPMLVASDVQVADGGDGVSLSAPELRLRLSWLALLTGRVRARELQLQGGQIHLPWPPAPFAAPPGLLVRVENAGLTLGHVDLPLPEARLQTDRAGVARFGGRTRLGGHDAAFAATLTPDGDTPRLQAALRIGDERLEWAAQFTPSGLSGGLTGQGQDAALLPALPAAPWQLHGTLHTDAHGAMLDDAALTVLGTAADGWAALDFGPTPHLALSLHAADLDLDAWRAHWAGFGHGEALPRLSLDLTADAAHVQGGVLHALHADLDTGPDGLALHRLSADLPGGDMHAQGMMTLAPRPHFTGTAALTTADADALLIWLNPATPRLPDTTPRLKLRWSGTVAIEPAVLTLHGAGALGDDAVAGDLAIRRADRPLLDAALHFETLHLDPLLPRAALPDGIDAAVKLQADHAVLGAITADGVAFDAGLAAGGLTLRQFSGAIGDLSLRANGQWADGAVRDAHVDVSGDGAGLARLTPRLAWLPSWPIVLHAAAEGTAASLHAHVTGQMGDIELDAMQVLSWAAPAGPARQMHGSLLLRHPAAARLVRDLGWPDPAPWLGTGSLSLVSHIDAQPDRVGVQISSLSAGDLHAGADLVAQLDTHRLEGRIQAHTLPIPTRWFAGPFLPDWAGDWQAALHLAAPHVTLGGDDLLRDLGTDLHWRDGTLSAETLSAHRGDGTINGHVSWKPSPPALAVDLLGERVALPELDCADAPAGLALGNGLVSGALSLAGDPSAPNGTLGGTAHVSLHGVSLCGLDARRSAPTLLDDADATLTVSKSQGQITASGTGPDGSLDASGTLSLNDGAMALQLGLYPGQRRAEGRPGQILRYAGNWGALRREPGLPPKTRGAEGRARRNSAQ